MPRSLRLTLIGWYGLLLTAVLVAFGATLYLRTRGALLEGIDAELASRSAAMVGALEWDEKDGWELDLSDDFLRGVAAEASYSIWAWDGTLLREGGERAQAAPSGTPGLRSVGDLRELEVEGPGGTCVLLARSIAQTRERLAALLASLVASGAAVLAMGLGGGWWLARRALAPLESLAATAGAISAQDLSQRLDARAAPAELEPLARAFNATLERLEQAFGRQLRFTADASHELRTPLAVVRTQAEQALRADRAPQEYRAALAACLRAAERMSGLSEGLLQLARADAGGDPRPLEPVALDALVREAVEHLRPVAEAEGVEVSCSTEPVRVSGVAAELGVALSNLLSNAVRYNRPGGRVEVACSRSDTSAIVRVADTGIGIPAEALPHVFERFYRLDSARSRARGGTGLGLAIAQRIVAAHGGSIDVESCVDEGSTFSLRLPAEPSAVPGAELTDRATSG